jgi:MerR family transcriptional regulator, repressor of the yfmOP operon
VTGEPRTFRIGEVAARTGTTPRTIRYYEEIGLLPAEGERATGAHRVYDERYVERLEEVLRLKELLGVSLDELRELITAERARAALRSEWHTATPGVDRRREILQEALGHAERQLEVVGRRREEITRLEKELEEKRSRIRERLAELASPAPAGTG